MRALCAISQEELESGSASTFGASAEIQAAGGPGTPINITTAAAANHAASPAPLGQVAGPRLFSLQKVVECAYQNMNRIRLVWGKLWAVIAAQLVGASCHPHRCVTYSTDPISGRSRAKDSAFYNAIGYNGFASVPCV